MNWITSITTSIIALFVTQLSAAEFSAEKIKHYSGYVRMTQEVKQYISDLPPEAITQIVDQLNFDRDGRGSNTFIMSFTTMKARELEANGIDYDKDYVFSKLTSFVRSAIETSDLGIGGGAMHSLKRFDHPEVIKLAKELEHSEDYLTQSNAKLLLQKHEERLKIKQIRENRAKSRVVLEDLTVKSAATQSASNEMNTSKDEKSPSFWIYGLSAIFCVVGTGLVIRANKKKDNSPTL